MDKAQKARRMSAAEADRIAEANRVAIILLREAFAFSRARAKRQKVLEPVMAALIEMESAAPQ